MAAMDFRNAINLNKNELQSPRIHNLASAPGSPVAGQMYYDTTDNLMLWRNNSIWIDPLDRSNHSGTQLAATISNLAGTVKTYRLDEFAAPNVDVPWNSKKITGLADGVSANDAVNLGQLQSAVDSAAAGIDSKPSVRALANSNITLSGTQTIDGVSLSVNDAVLVRGQSTGSQNGVYLVQSGTWTRRLTEDSTQELTPGAFWFVEEGTTYARTQWRIENTGSIVVGTTSITINQFGAGAVYTASLGVQLVGSDFRANLGTGLTLSGNQIVPDYTYIGKKGFSADIGNGSAVDIAVTHNFGTRDVVPVLRLAASPYSAVWSDWEATDTNNVTFHFASAPTTNELRATIVPA